MRCKIHHDQYIPLLEQNWNWWRVTETRRDSFLVISWAKFQKPKGGVGRTFACMTSPRRSSPRAYKQVSCRFCPVPGSAVCKWTEAWWSSGPRFCHWGCFCASGFCVLRPVVQIPLPNASPSLRSPTNYPHISTSTHGTMRATNSTRVSRSRSLCCPLFSEGRSSQNCRTWPSSPALHDTQSMCLWPGWEVDCRRRENENVGVSGWGGCFLPVPSMNLSHESQDAPTLRLSESQQEHGCSKFSHLNKLDLNCLSLGGGGIFILLRSSNNCTSVCSLFPSTC